MITKQTKTNNTYCIDPEKQYISLVHPLFQNTHNQNIDIDDYEYYKKKYDYLQKSKFSNIHSNHHGRISPTLIKNQLINLKHLVFETTDACNLPFAF
jgi:hypothetical protein